jgi:lysophospholipase L1-like esterase
MAYTRLIIGDSLLHHIRYVKDCRIYALSGINLSELNSYLKNNVKLLDGIQSILVHCGTNNITKNSQSDIISQFNNLILTIRNVNPNINILISSILARPIDFDIHGHKCAELNSKLKTLCKEHRIRFVASHRLSLCQGRPIENIFYDGLHLNDVGVRKLKQVFSQNLAEHGNRPTREGFESHYFRRSEWKTHTSKC